MVPQQGERYNSSMSDTTASLTLPRGLCVVTNADYIAAGMLGNAVQHAILGGAQMVEYHDPTRETGRRKREAATLRDICRDHAVLLVVHGDLRLAGEVGADGVLLGARDRGLGEAREALGSGAFVGAWCAGSIGLARRAADDGVDYVKFGSFYPSRSNPGLERADSSLLGLARDLGVHVVASGGINADNGTQLIRAGADMLAVSSGVFDHRDPESAARRLAALFAN